MNIIVPMKKLKELIASGKYRIHDNKLERLVEGKWKLQRFDKGIWYLPFQVWINHQDVLDYDRNVLAEEHKKSQETVPALTMQDLEQVDKAAKTHTTEGFISVIPIVEKVYVILNTPEYEKERARRIDIALNGGFESPKEPMKVIAGLPPELKHLKKKKRGRKPSGKPKPKKELRREPYQKVTESQIEEMKKYIKAGKSDYFIAKTLGIKYHTLIHHTKKLKQQH